MGSRENILGRIREALQQGVLTPRTEPATVWPLRAPSIEQRIALFIAEVEQLNAEAITCTNIEQAQHRLHEMIAAHDWSQIGVMDSALCRALVSQQPETCVTFEHAAWEPREMETLSVGVVEAEQLLVDSGSCAIRCVNKQQRLLCYLPPVSLIVGRIDRLREHLPAAWTPIHQKAADPEQRGELVIVTGPSRTADIEKKLILGVHGPKRVIVILIHER
jgi:L-lactate dehydrogenase complex protein LldG